MLEINKFTTAPAHYSAERYSTGVLRALTNMQQATDNAIRRTVVSGVMIGVLTVAQAAERVGVTEDAVRSWGILPEWEREPIDAGCENDDEADQRLAA